MVFYNFCSIFLLATVAAQSAEAEYVKVDFTLRGHWSPDSGEYLAYIVVEDGPGINQVGFRNKITVPFEVFNDFEGASDGMVFIPPSDTIFYPSLFLNQWGEGQLQSWISRDADGAAWQGWKIFLSGFKRPDRPEPVPTQLFALLEGQKIAKAVSPGSGKLATQWAKVKVAR